MSTRIYKRSRAKYESREYAVEKTLGLLSKHAASSNIRENANVGWKSQPVAVTCRLRARCDEALIRCPAINNRRYTVYMYETVILFGHRHNGARGRVGDGT